VDVLDSDTVQHLIGHYGYGAIFVIVMLESAGIPLQGILVTAAVYAATKHALDIRWVIAAAAGGAILGDSFLTFCTSSFADGYPSQAHRDHALSVKSELELYRPQSFQCGRIISLSA
jgi:membrane protein DedA with SNARE-associated domain